MFPSVTWHLYDWRKFDIAPSKMIHIHSGRTTGGDFNDTVAKSYARASSGSENARASSGSENARASSGSENARASSGMADQMLFLCDIRSDNKEAEVLRDMQQQARWVRIMEPRMSALKFHPPYPVEGEPDEFPYLPGYVVLQPFNKKASSETRLIVTGGGDMNEVAKDSDPLRDVVYSKKQYESQLFYHNMITRSTPLYNNVSGGKVVYDDRELDNHYDSIYFLHALLQYIKLSRSPSTPLLLAREIMKKLSDRRKHPMILKAERESAQIEYKDVSKSAVKKTVSKKK